jgi:hypothetical protein
VASEPIREKPERTVIWVASVIAEILHPSWSDGFRMTMLAWIGAEGVIYVLRSAMLRYWTGIASPFSILKVIESAHCAEPSGLVTTTLPVAVSLRACAS